MSSIDERIVQMRFDNKDFESNVGTTMSTLEKLKEKLKFTKSDEGIQNLKGAFNNFNVSGMAAGIDSINSKFSALGIAGMEVIRRLTNSVLDMGERIVKGFTIQPVLDGFEEYELKMNSVQTILMGARTDEGLPVTLDMVNEKLNELNTYADRTIYSFSDMTSNIGKFTNAGVSLNDSVAAIQGISNVAALSGANAQQASHAMYNFAQALSSGAVKLIDWKSIENANMATVEFKQTLIDTALEIGTLVKEGDEYVSTTTDMQGKVSEAFTATSRFNDSLSAQWMTTDVLTAALAKYSDETTDLGKKAFKAATQVKTFTQLIDTVKEALGSGWAQSFEYIIGDFEEARDMWTEVSDAISSIIDPIADARNEMLKFWHDNGGRQAMIDAFKALWKNIKGVAAEIKDIGTDAFERTFGKIDGARLVEITKSIRDFFQNFVVSDALKNAAETVLTTFFNVLEGGAVQLQRATRFVSQFWRAIEPGRKLLYNIAGAIADVVSLISGMLSRIGNLFESNGGLGALANGLANLFNGLMLIVKPVIDKIDNWFQDLYNSDFVQNIAGKLTDISKKFEEFTESIDFAGIANKVSDAVSKLWDVISKIGRTIGILSGGVWDFVSSVLGIGEGSEDSGDKLNLLADGADDVESTLGSLKDNIVQWFLNHAPADMIEDVSKALEKLNGFLKPIKEKIDAIKKSFEDGTWYVKLKEWLSDVVDKVNELKDTLVKFVKNKAVLAFTSVWEYVTDSFNKFVDAIKRGWKVVKPVLQSLFGDDLYTAVNRIFEFLAKAGGIKGLFAFSDGLNGISNLIDGLSDGLSKLKTNLEKATINVTKSLLAPLKSMASKNNSEAIRNLAISVGILTTALIAMSFVEWSKLQSGLAAVGEMLSLLLGFYAAFEFVSKKMNSSVNSDKGLLGGILGSHFGGSSLTSAAVGFIGLAASILILATSIVKLAEVPFLDIQKSLLAIVELMAGLYLFSKYTEGIKVAGVDVAVLSIAIDLLSIAVEKIGKLDFETWLKGLGGLALVMIELAAFLHDVETVSAKSFTGMITLAAGVRILVSSVIALSNLDIWSLVLGLSGLGVVLIELGAFLKSMESINLSNFAQLIVLAVGVRALVSSVKALGNMDFESWIQGLGGVAVLLIELSAFMHDMNGVAGMSIKTAASLVIMTTALIGLSVAVKILGSMSTGGMIQGLFGIAAALAIFVVAVKQLDGSSPLIIASAAAMVVMSAAVLLLVPAIKALAAIDFWSLVKAIAAIAAVFVVFGAAGKILGNMAMDMMKAAAGIAIMAAAVMIVVPPLLSLAAVPMDQLGKALLTLAGIFVIFGVAGAVLGQISEYMFAAAAGILAMSLSAAAAGGAMISIGIGLSKLGTGVMDAMDAILALLQSILGGLPVIGDDIDKWIGKRRESLKNNMDPKDAEQTGEDWVKALGTGVENGTGSVEGALETVKTDVETTGKETGSGYSSNLLSGLGIDDLKGMLSGDMGDLTGEIEDLLKNSGTTAGEGYADNILDGFKSTDLEGLLSGDMSSMTGNLEEMFGQSGEDAGDAWAEGLDKNVRKGTLGITVTIGNETKFVGDETLNHWMALGLITGKEYASAIALKTKEGAADIYLSAETALTRLEGIDITIPGAIAADSYLSGLREKLGGAKYEIADDTARDLTDGLKDTSDDYEDTGKDNLESYLAGMLGEPQHVEDTGEEVADTALDGIDARDFEDKGEDAAYGFANGMDDADSYVEAKARQLAAKALKALASEMDINSPSKETMKLGKFGGQGFALGFKATASEVKKSASGLANSGLTAMQDAMEHLRSLLNFDSEFDPTIRPVLDLQQIQNGMSTIGSMLGNGQFALSGAFGIDQYALAGIRNVASAASRIPVGDQSVVNAIGDLQSEVSSLKGAMEQMKFEVDGKSIGSVAYREVDRRLGNTVVRNRREGRG